VEALIYLDTHVAAWLYAGRGDLLTARGAKLINTEKALMLSPAVVLELEYLHEIGRLAVGGKTIARSLAAEIGTRVHDMPFAAVIESALDLDWTRDPFDRMIVGQASIAKSRLLTKDRSIRQHYRQATW
jgi:PIN domain nuclease of toxin-antitoxin system